MLPSRRVGVSVNPGTLKTLIDRGLVLIARYALAQVLGVGAPILRWAKPPVTCTFLELVEYPKEIWLVFVAAAGRIESNLIYNAFVWTIIGLKMCELFSFGLEKQAS